MTKFGRHVRFGYSPLPTASDPTRPLQLATMAETLGLDYLLIQDHSSDAGYQDPLNLLTAIGTASNCISLCANIVDFRLRSPALAAKAAASLDLLTGGRVDIAIDATAFSIVPEGDAARSDQDALAALEEALQLMRFMWSGEQPAQFESKFFPLNDVEPCLVPSHRIDIWLGIDNPRTLATAERLADGWLATFPAKMQLEDLAAWRQDIDDAATSAGRDPSEIQRVWTINGTIGDEESDIPFQGTAKQWAQTLTELAADIGVDTFILMQGMMEDKDAEEQLNRFAQEVVPLAREMTILRAGANATGLARAVQGSGASGATRAEEATDDVDWVDETSMESFPASDPPASSSFT